MAANCTVFAYFVSFYLTVRFAYMICFLYIVCNCHAIIKGSLLTYLLTYIHVGSTLHKTITLTSDLTVVACHSTCEPSLALLAQVVFLLECGHTHTHRVTDVTHHPSYTASVGNKHSTSIPVL